jgi:hypothetical protein
LASEAEYEALRRSVRDRLQLDLRRPDLRITGITSAVIQATRLWRMPPRRVSWDWTRLVKRRGKGHFEVAFWWGPSLCGLAFGKVGPDWLAIHYLEGCPEPHPLKGQILPLAVAALEAQALAQSIPGTRLVDPFVEIEDRYIERGYARVAPPGLPVYLFKRRPNP